jgi:hypothetical protein
MGAVQYFFPGTAESFQAMVAPVGVPTDFKLADLDPRQAYDAVIKKITSGEIGSPFPIGSPVRVSPIPFNPNGLGVRIDPNAIAGARAAGIAADIQRNYNRAQDLINYGRNPMAWHGPPPF